MDEWCFDNMDSCLENGTGWSGAFTFNGIILFIQGVNFVVMTFGAYWWTPRVIGTLCNLCLGCCHCLAFTSALSAAYGVMGSWCVVNISPNQMESKNDWSDEWTY